MPGDMSWRSPPSFPAECRRILETLGTVYRHDAEAREQRLSPEDRLVYHQTHSGPMLTDLHAWLTAQLADHLVEPNSSLGQAITYLLNHWTPLTLFLRQPGAPLDNNLLDEPALAASAAECRLPGYAA